MNTHRGMAQSVARRSDMPEVSGSNPDPATRAQREAGVANSARPAALLPRGPAHYPRAAGRAQTVFVALAILSLAGCCGATLRDPGVAGSLADNARGWKLAAEYAAAAGWPAHDGLAGLPPDDVVPIPPSWRARFVAWRAQAMILDYAAQGGTMTLKDAIAAAEAEVPK